MRAPSYADPDQKAAFAEWLEAERVRTGTAKTALSAAIGAEGTNRVGQFLNGNVLPLPATLRTLCGVLGIPWFVAFANAGYYRQLLMLLEDLAEMSRKWCDEDKVSPRYGEGSFRSSGVAHIAGQIAVEAIKDEAYARRYVMGSYRDTGTAATPMCVVPKPLAVALFVGTAGFPRRGDIYKDGRSSYAAEVLEVAVDVVNQADGKDDSRKPTGLLANADSVLRSKTLSFVERRPIAGEYVTAWCDRQCQDYTYYARLATYWRLGEAGSSKSTMLPYTFMPEIRIAECPDPEIFRL